MCISNLPTKFSEWKASSSLISDCFFCVFFFISIREQSDQSLFFFCLLDAAIYHFSLFSETSPYLYWREKSLLLPKFKDKFSFCKKKRIGLCFTDGNMWPSKISNGPPKNRKGAKHGPQNYWPVDNTVTLSLHGRMYYLPKFEAYIKRWDPQFQWWDPHHIQSWVPRTPKHSTWCKTLSHDQ